MRKRETTLVGIFALAAMLLVLCLAFRMIFLANLIQFASALMASILSFQRARRSPEPNVRQLWFALFLAFGFWVAGQSYYAGHLAIFRTAPIRPSPADIFWLFFSFPILLIASQPREEVQKDLTGWLDMAQVLIAVVQVFAAMVLVPGAAIIDRVYDIQGFSTLFASAIRYSTAKRGVERVFFRNLTAFVLCYDLVGLLMQVFPQTRDLPFVRGVCWSLPFLTFSAMALQPSQDAETLENRRMPRVLLPAHIHGVGAMGLVLTSIASSALLMVHHEMLGVLGLSASCGVFAMRMAARESKLKRTQMELEHDNSHDHLTGLVNRRSLEMELGKLGRAGSGKSFLLLLDLDRFKIINDSMGHDLGDCLLVRVADVLRSAVCSGDIVSRFGGDEFVVLLNGCKDSARACEIAERILSQLSVPISLNERVVHVTGSIGIAELQEEDSTLRVLHNADAAMYMAKSVGRNCVHIFDHTVLEKAARDLELESDLRRSIADGSIWVAYQPLFQVDTGELIAFEALARWTHPKQGDISPERFIPLAEETGLILQLGEQVMNCACAQVATWNREFGKRFCVGVNVSASQITEPCFLVQVKQALLHSQLDPTLLRFEITESALLKNEPSIAAALQAINALGIEISLDDFGTGYSSLNYLMEFPFYSVKIDKSFLRGVDRDEGRAILMGTIVQLVKNLKKKVVAEGVETVEQVKFLATIECDVMQGFLLSRPLPQAQMTEFLRGRFGEGATAEESSFTDPCLDS